MKIYLYSETEFDEVAKSFCVRKWQLASIPSSFSRATVFKSIPLVAFRRTNKPKGRDSRPFCFGTRFLDQWYLKA